MHALWEFKIRPMVVIRLIKRGVIDGFRNPDDDNLLYVKRQDVARLAAYLKTFRET